MNQNQQVLDHEDPNTGCKFTFAVRADGQKLNEEQRLRDFITEAIKRLEMRQLGDTIIFNVPLEVAKMDKIPFEDEGGFSVVAVLSTSHIAGHAWPLRGYFNLEAYSCRPFNSRVIETLLREYFDATQIKVTDESESIKLEL